MNIKHVAQQCREKRATTFQDIQQIIHQSHPHYTEHQAFEIVKRMIYTGLLQGTCDRADLLDGPLYTVQIYY